MATILIVDDQEVNIMQLKAHLAELRHRLVSVKNGLDAWKIIQEDPPDLILLDLIMPQLDGYEVCKRVKQHPKLKSIPIIVITGLDSVVDYVKALEQGADDFISKPVHPAALVARVKAYLRSKSLSDEVLQLNELRQDLTKMIVHDLRNPMTGIMGNLELVMMRGNLPDEAQSSVADAFQCAREASNLIDNILAVEKMESGTLLINDGIVDIPAAVKQALSYYKSELIKKHISARCEEDDTLSLRGDKDLIGRVIQNLITNAVKFSPTQTQIEIHWSGNEEKVSVSVANHCPVIEEQDLHRVFDKFSQLSDTLGHVQIGCGLGLAFCKMAVNAHGGNISVCSPCPGWKDGVRFEFWLPASNSARKTAEAGVAQLEVKAKQPYLN